MVIFITLENEQIHRKKDLFKSIYFIDINIKDSLNTVRNKALLIDTLKKKKHHNNNQSKSDGRRCESSKSLGICRDNSYVKYTKTALGRE